MRGISKSPVPACGTGLLPRRSTVPALGSSRNLPDSDLLDLPDQSDCLNGEVETHGTSTLNKCQTPPRHARRGFRGRLGLVRLAVQVGIRIAVRVAGAGGPRRAWVGRLKIGARGKPACRAPDSEPESGPR